MKQAYSCFEVRIIFVLKPIKGSEARVASLYVGFTMRRQDTNSSSASFKGSTTSQSGSVTDNDQDMDKVYRRYRETLMNSSRLVDEGGTDMDGDCLGMGVIRKEVDLTNDEKQYLLAVERGDIPSTRQYLSVGTQTGLNINCVDPLGRTALLVAIENENIEMIELLLSYHVDVGDALLHAINEENVEAVELLLNHEYSLKGEEALHQSVPSSSFTPDITPIILAAHRDNYEIIKLLLDRGYRIPKPHDVRCICKNCLQGSNEDSLRHSRSRINAYRALASPSLIALSSKDPILTSFELSRELKRLSKLENEFKLDYEKLAKKCKEFAVDLLEQTRGSKELEIILNHDIGNHGVTPPEQTEPPVEEKVRLSRLKLAIKFNQKKFVAHPNCQQLLASIWYEGLPGFRRHSIIRRLLVTTLIGISFPFLSVFYLVAPKSGPGKLLRKPFIKFICHSASYLTFLVLLILVSQRVEIPFPWASKAESVSDIDKISQEVRGAPATNVEWMILAYVAGLVWAEVKQLWDEGAHEYVHDMWNILDFVTNSLYIATLTLRVIAYLQVQQEKSEGKESANLQRKDWNAYDPNLIAEALFAAANIFSSLKLIYMFTVNPHLGPLQISLGRMIVDIMKFAIVYMMVLFSFSCGLNHLYWYYATLREKECKIYNIKSSCDRRYKSFANLFEIIQSLYWSIYGLVDLEHAELEEPHEFTEFIGKLMFGSYSWIALVVLLNLLIAMMSNSYQNISSQADEEWKFARSKLWISYFEDSGTLPPPFNIIPSPKTFYYLLLWFKSKLCACSKHQKRSRWQSIRKIVKKINEREIRYQAVMRDLIKRYIMQKQRGPERGEGVTEDDVSEIKQDISSFRYELLEILRSNGMKTPNPNQPKPTNRRRLSSRKRSQMLNRSFGKGMSSGFPSNGCLDLGSKPTTPTFGNGSTIPDTIVEESVMDTTNTLGVKMLEVPSLSPSPSTSNLIDFSPESAGQCGSASNRKQKASLHLHALRTDEGLGESIDLNSEHSNYSPKLPDKFEADSQRPSKHERNVSGPYLDPDFPMLSNYSPGEGHTDRSGKRVTFL